jgi:predicted membrane metal-binding protein
MSHVSERQTPSAVSDRGTGELVKQMTEQLSALVRAELRLAQAEMTAKGKRAGKGAGLAGVAGLVAAYAVAALLGAVIAALSLVWPVWVSALAVGFVLTLAAAVVALLARKQVQQISGPVPERAVEGLRTDIDEVKTRMRRP